MINLISVISIHTNNNLLKKFIKHYMKLGVDDFFILLHVDCNEVSVEFFKRKKDEFCEILNEFGINFFDVIKTSWHPSVQYFNTVKIQKQLSVDDWILNVDVDEFVTLDGLKLILNSNNEGFVKGNFVDRITETGILEEIDPNQELWDQFPVNALVTKKLLQAPTNKIIANKNKFTCSPGHHYLEGKENAYLNMKKSVVYPVYHFKWHAGVIDTLKRRVETYKKLGEKREFESIRFLEYIKKNGRILKEDVL